MKFSNKDLARMMLPLFMEQLLVILVGMADTLVISYADQPSVAGVSLVNQFNTIFIYLFSALAAGGAVVISQYLGSRDKAAASRTAGQLCLFAGVFSLGITALVLAGNRVMLTLLFGSVETDVMNASVEYLRISAYSYPMLAVYNAGAALYRSVGRTKTTMYISVVSNIVNILGNCIGVFLLHAGVAGVAWPSFAARALSAAWITVLCFRRDKDAFFRAEDFRALDRSLLKKILGIAVPNGVESGVFQLVKVALFSLTATFGTYQIAANGVAQSIWNLAAMSGIAMGPVFITVVGMSMGGGDTDGTEEAMHRLLKMNLVISAAWNVLIFGLTPLILRFYVLEPRTKELVMQMVLLHNVFNSVAAPFSASLGNGLRATGDVKFTMYAALISTLGVRMILSYVLAVGFGMEVMGVTWAMCIDWSVRGILQYGRLKSGVWKKFRVI